MTINVQKTFVIILTLDQHIFILLCDIASNPDNIFFVANPFEFQVVGTGIRFILQKF